MSKHHCFAYGVLAGAVIVLGMLLILQQPQRAAFAQAANSNNRMIAVTGQIENGIDALYLVDTDPANPRLLVYEARNGRTLKLIGARDIQWDMKMLDWVNSGGKGASGDPTVYEVKKAYEEQEKKKKDK